MIHTEVAEVKGNSVLIHAEITNNPTDEKGYIKTGLNVKDSPYWKANLTTILFRNKMSGYFYRKRRAI